MSYVKWIRTHVGSQKIFLVRITLILVDDNGRFLVQHRPDFDRWELPRSLLEIDEDIRQCAHRNLLEETGLSVNKLRLVSIDTQLHDEAHPNRDHTQHYTVCLTGRLTGGAIRPEVKETKNLVFLPRVEAEKCFGLADPRRSPATLCTPAAQIAPGSLELPR
jgi:ADP-ribose pyrophosphatase YjhB (NUDIX family)